MSQGVDIQAAYQAYAKELGRLRTKRRRADAALLAFSVLATIAAVAVAGWHGLGVGVFLVLVAASWGKPGHRWPS